MNRRSSVAATTATPKDSITRTYLQLQRLRQLVQKAETSRVQHVVEAKPRSSGINPQRGHQA
jgi:hypothetical protein